MGEATVNPKVLEDALLKTLPALFPSLLGRTGDASVEFYDKFQRAADDHDRDFIKKYDEDLSSTLIFAGLFSAVTSAFIVDVQSKLEPDFEEMNHTLLKIIAGAALGNTLTGPNAALPEWNGPDSTVVLVQAILYSSLSASLLAAFIAMLGKQWLNRYASVERGSAVDRGRQRKRKMDGMVTWRFGLVMECLPLMLQVALLLLGYALSSYLFSINRVVASVVIGFTTFGLLFYFLIVSAATLSYNCPFQTPLSLILRFLIRFDGEHKKYLNRSGECFRRVYSWTKGRLTPKSGGSCGLGGFGTSNENSFGNHIELGMTCPSSQPAPIFKQKSDLDGYVLDSNCIAWMLEMPAGTDAATVIARFIPEIVWHADVQAVPLERLYETVLECFDHSKPAFRDRAYLSTKALLHMGIQRKCIGDESENAAFRSIMNRHKIMGYRRSKGDSDLESTLGIIDRVFGSFGPMDWHHFSFTVPHHTWMGHILLYRAWYVLREGESLPRDIMEFIHHFLRLEHTPPTPIIADCLFIVGLALGINLHIDDLSVSDKSHEVKPQIMRIYEKLSKIFRNPAPAAEEIDHALLALRVIARLPENHVTLSWNDVAQESYLLFRLIMRAPVSFACPQDKKWEASRLTMHAAYKYDRYLPRVEDPQDILCFLDHHFSLVARGDQGQDEPIHNALRALAYASGPVTIDTLKGFDPTGSSFVHGVCYAFRGDRPLQLRKAALLFLPLISDRWFNTPHPVMEPDQMRSLCVNWASVVDKAYHSYGYRMATLAVLLGMINSHHWRPHVVMEKWELLGRFTLVPVDSQHLRTCIDNLDLLMDVVINAENSTAMAVWLAILWYRYRALTPQVREQLETVTNEIAQSREVDFELCLSVADSELGRARGALARLETAARALPGGGIGSTTATLRAKVDNLRQAKTSLIAFKLG